jgi:hypothetical protein
MGMVRRGAPAAWLGVALGVSGIVVGHARERTAPFAASVAPERSVGGEYLDEGFDETFPPAGWTREGTLAVPYTWHSTGTAPHVYSGAKSLLVRWREERVQDEKLTSPVVRFPAGVAGPIYLSFWYHTDPFWFAGAGTDFRVQASLDGGPWEEIWSLDGSTETGWAWRNAVVDVTSHAEAGGDFRLRFRYEALDAADVGLDEVRLGALVPPGPPENDDCAGALAAAPRFTLGPAAGQWTLTGNNSFARPDYPLDAAGSCTGYGHAGRDVVWIVDVAAGDYLTATMTTLGDWDDTLFLISDCSRAQESCVAGDRRFPDGSTVTWHNGSSQTARLYLVASAHGAGSGQFEVRVSLAQETVVTSSSFGAVKARYR